MFDSIKEKGFEVLTLHHAEVIRDHDLAQAEAELEEVLLEITLPVEELIRGGGGDDTLEEARDPC